MLIVVDVLLLCSSEESNRVGASVDVLNVVLYVAFRVDQRLPDDQVSKAVADEDDPSIELHELPSVSRNNHIMLGLRTESEFVLSSAKAPNTSCV